MARDFTNNRSVDSQKWHSFFNDRSHLLYGMIEVDRMVGLSLNAKGAYVCQDNDNGEAARIFEVRLVIRMSYPIHGLRVPPHQFSNGRTDSMGKLSLGILF